MKIKNVKRKSASKKAATEKVIGIAKENANQTLNKLNKCGSIKFNQMDNKKEKMMNNIMKEKLKSLKIWIKEKSRSMT